MGLRFQSKEAMYLQDIFPVGYSALALLLFALCLYWLNSQATPYTQLSRICQELVPGRQADAVAVAVLSSVLACGTNQLTQI